VQPKDNTKVVFSGRLSDLMQKSQVTQVWLAEEFHVSQAAVSKWLNGTIPSGETLVRLAHFFGVTPEEMVGLESCRQPEAKLPGGPLPTQGMAESGKGRSQASLDAEIDVFFEKLKSRVKAGLSRSSPTEIEAHLKMLANLFGNEKFSSTKRKK
jgi:transcriptional regulator with XRE-family HTH domain